MCLADTFLTRCKYAFLTEVKCAAMLLAHVLICDNRRDHHVLQSQCFNIADAFADKNGD